MMKRMILAMSILSMAFVLHAQKFGHVTSELLLQAMPEYDSAQVKLQNLQKQYELEIEQIQVEINKKIEEFNKNEATMSNLFAVKDNQLYTPDLRRSGVNGIMRDMVIDAAKRNGIQVSCLDLSMDDLFDMEELFISNSLMGIRPVSKMAHRSFADQNITKIIFKDLLNTKDNHVEVVN